MTLNGEIYCAVLLRALTNAQLDASKIITNVYDFSVYDVEAPYHIIDASILKSCLLYSHSNGRFEFKIDSQYTSAFASAINLINEIASLNLIPNDVSENNIPSYPGITVPTHSPDMSTMPLQFVSYLASLLFYNPKTHAPFSNIFNMNNDFQNGIPTEHNTYTTFGQQLVEQLDTRVIQLMFDQLMAIDPSRFDVTDNATFKPLPFKSGDIFSFDLGINSTISVPPNPNNLFSNLQISNLFKNNPNIISNALQTPPLFNTAYVNATSTTSLLTMTPKIWRIKLLLQDRQSLMQLPSVAATNLISNLLSPLEQPSISDSGTFTGTGLIFSSIQDCFTSMTNISTPTQGTNVNLKLGKLFSLVKSCNTLLVKILSNLSNVSNSDCYLAGGNVNDVDGSILKSALSSNITYITQVLLLLVSLSNSTNSSLIFKQKELMLLKLSSNIITNISTSLMTFFSNLSPNITYNPADIPLFTNIIANRSNIPASPSLVLILDCLYQLKQFTTEIQTIMSSNFTLSDDTSIGFCEPIKLNSMIQNLVSDMTPISSGKYSDYFQQYCLGVQHMLQIVTYILEGGSFNPANYIMGIINSKNASVSSMLLNYGIVITDNANTNANIVLSLQGDTLRNTLVPSMFDTTGTVTANTQAQSIFTKFSSEVSIQDYTDLNIFINGKTLSSYYQ